MNPEVKDVPVAGLIVDPEVQRSVQERRVLNIVDNFDPEAVGTITVSHRGNGTYHVIDGQHRVEALKILGVAQVRSAVFEGLSVEEEARMFRLLNNTRQLSALDRFRVRGVEGEPVAVAVNAILAKYDWKVGGSRRDGSIIAVGALERAYRLSPVVLERAIATITRAWGHAEAAVDGVLIEGLALVFDRFGEAVNDTELADRLAKYPGGPARMVGAARTFKDMYRMPVVAGVADTVVQLYNVHRKTKALPAWRSQ